MRLSVIIAIMFTTLGCSTSKNVMRFNNCTITVPKKFKVIHSSKAINFMLNHNDSLDKASPSKIYFKKDNALICIDYDMFFEDSFNAFIDNWKLGFKKRYPNMELQQIGYGDTVNNFFYYGRAKDFNEHLERHYVLHLADNILYRVRLIGKEKDSIQNEKLASEIIRNFKSD